MTPKTRKRLEEKLTAHGLSVLLTRDYDAILLHLARLAEFERRMVVMGDHSPQIRAACDHIKKDQQSRDVSGDPLDVLYIPAILTHVNRALYTVLDRDGAVCLERLPVAVTAFMGILCAEVRS